MFSKSIGLCGLLDHSDYLGYMSTYTSCYFGMMHASDGQDGGVVDYALVLLPERAKSSYRLLLACGEQKSSCT